MNKSSPTRADNRSRSVLITAAQDAASGDPNQVGGRSTTCITTICAPTRSARAFTDGTTARLSAEKSTGNKMRLKAIITDLLANALAAINPTQNVHAGCQLADR